MFKFRHCVAIAHVVHALPFRPPEDWSKRGETTRPILGILLQAAEPMSCRDMAVRLIAERGVDQDDPRPVRLMTKRAGGQRDRALVISHGADRAVGVSKLTDVLPVSANCVL